MCTGLLLPSRPATLLPTPPFHAPPTPRHQLLACIGEGFDAGDEICGATVSVRHGKNRVELWTKSAANEARQLAVGRALRAALRTPDNIRLGYAFFVSRLGGCGGWDVGGRCWLT